MKFKMGPSKARFISSEQSLWITTEQPTKEWLGAQKYVISIYPRDTEIQDGFRYLHNKPIAPSHRKKTGQTEALIKRLDGVEFPVSYKRHSFLELI